MIPTSELSVMREAILDLLPDTCVILSPTNTADGQGGVVQTWGTVDSSVACRLDKINKIGQEGVVGAGMQPYPGYMLTIPHNVTVLSTYRITHGGYTYAVMPGNEDQSNLIVKRIILERV